MKYSFQCTSDDYLLSTKAIPFIPSYVNRTQGQILSDLAEVLCPGFFDTSLVQDGDIIPFFAYDPTKSWSQVAKTFGDSSRYRWKVRDKRIYYVPYGDDGLGISYDDTKSKSEGKFDPRGLQTTIMPTQITNDITIIGDIEAGNNREDYFIGDGFTADFPLLHKVFHGSSSLLLQEAWSEGSGKFNAQQWFLQDPFNNFDFSVGALNITTPVGAPVPALGDSYLQLQNGVELAGGLLFDNGEFTFNDYCSGIIGGIYTDETFTNGALLAGFQITSPGTITPGASGAAGINIQPLFSGGLVGSVVVTQQNHTYVLQTLIAAPAYTRYQQIFRTVDGEQFGGAESQIAGSITFNIQDYDIAAATGFYYQPVTTSVTVPGVVLPAFALYGHINNLCLNITNQNVTIAKMPLGALQALEGPSGLWWPSGLILPMLPAYSGGFIGPAPPWSGDVTSSGTFLVTGSGNLFPGPLRLSNSLTQLVMGNGFQLQTAQITQGNSADTLQFYAQTIPAAGTPIWLQTWEAQAAVSRLQASGSIVQEAFIVGDDGIRSAIVSNLSPLPRTSEDCDNAALAYLVDHGSTLYNGTYRCTSLFFNQTTADLQYYPTCGRFLFVNSPARNLVGQKMLVTGMTVTSLNLSTDTLQYQLQFGVDTQLEKMLHNFVDLQPPLVLNTADTANPPNPRYTVNVDNSFLPDLQAVHVDMGSISPTLITVVVYDDYSGPIEVRTQDTGWGGGPTLNYVGTFSAPYFQLQRTQIDQQWFMRPVHSGLTSRRSKVLRVRYPVKPSPPRFVGQNFTALQFNFQGDQRNIYGLELRMKLADGTTLVAVQKPVASYSDMTIDLQATPFVLTPDYSNTTWTVQAFFFNAHWDYSDPVVITAVNSNLVDTVVQIAYQLTPTSP